MPITVTVRSGAASSGEMTLTFDSERIVFGRGEGCDVRLPDPSVSHRHASLRTSGKDYMLIDEGSTNGTFAGDVALAPNTPRIVKDGELVRLGRVWIELATGHRPATPDLGLATKDLAMALVRDALERAGDDTRPKITVVEGPDIGAEMLLEEEGRAYILGRAEALDLPLADADASREHAQVVRRRGVVLLRDLGSRNGTFLGDNKIPAERDVPWRAPTMVRVGATVLSLDEPVATALAELEALPDDALPPMRSVPPPPKSLSSLATQEPEAPPSEVRDAGVGGAAPMVAVPPPAQPSAGAAAAAKKKGWNSFDVFVVLAAIAIIGGSLAGLAWLLRG
jgi:pSer/pThr/pTyr-binding forkhead associated (FHA) protein